MIDPQQFAEHTLQLPAQLSTSSVHVDELYYRIYWLSVVLFVGIIVAMVYFAWKFRKRPGHKAEPTGHNMVLEVGWTIAPMFVLVALFHWGFKGYMDMSVAPVDAEEIRVRAFQWGWDFEYKNGGTDNKLHVPKGRPVKFIISSNDVLHAFFIPEMRVKRDAVPGMYSSLWFEVPESTATGTKVVLTCAEYCGGKSKDQNGNELDPKQFQGHWSMQSDVIIEDQKGYDAYLDGLVGNKPPEVLGKDLWSKKQCAGCHTIDGAKGVAPTWKGLFGKDETMNDGKHVKVDENYIRESILDPNAKIVQGYASPSVMPTFKGTLKDRDIDALVAFIKTLKD